MRTRLFWCISVVVFGLLGCEREALVVPDEAVEGYEISGKLIDGLGSPLVGIPVRLYYDFQYIDDGEPESPNFQVTNGAQVIRVSVYDSEGLLVRTLYNGTYPVGTMRVEWDRKLSSTVFASNGVYTVQFRVDGELRKSYPVIVDEMVTAMTDSVGFFVISNKHLPVGFYPVPLYTEDNAVYLGQFRITEVVLLEFVLPTFSKLALVTLTKGSTTPVNVTIQ